MKFSSNVLFIGFILVSLFISGCKSEDDKSAPTDNNHNQLNLINSVTTIEGGMTVNLFAEKAIKNQYTKIYLEIKDNSSNQIIENADVTILPGMDMGEMMHHAPVENPSHDAKNGFFEAAVVFTMPGEWQLDVTIYNTAADVIETAIIPLEIGLAEPTRTHVVTPLNNTMPIVISYLKPTSPKVGVNDFEITIHQENDDMTFSPVENYTVVITPDMPSMGHGSPNNVNPTHSSQGHYNGKVNFTMTGLWRIELEIYDNTTAIDTTSYFEITF